MSAHLPILPIVLPLLAGAVLVLVERRGIALQRLVAGLGMAGLLGLSIALLALADSGAITIYRIGNWPAHLGITLVVDRLAAWMVLTTTLLAAACLLHASAGWDRRAPHFHAFFQLLLMGLNGAFLTGDLFNLFVFFEVLLAASYGLLLSGGRGGRMRVGFHYVVFNIAASTLFLIALGLLYGLVGVLNMAEVAARVGAAEPGDRALLQAVGGLLLVVFCAKGAILPLYLWLPSTYGGAQASVAAFFVVMTKVGLYAVLRVFTLVFAADPALAGAAWSWLLPAGIATLLLAGLGTMAAVRLRVLVAYLVLVSAGTLFIAFALARADSIGAGLYYLAHSVFVGAALFLIAEAVRERRGTDRTNVVLPMLERAVPGTLYVVAAIAAIGLPPLAGFIGKLGILQSVPAERVGWVWGALLVSSFFVLVALTRSGSRLFWRVPPAEAPPPITPKAQPRPRLGRRRETLAIVLLLGYVLAMSVAAGPVLRYAMASGKQVLEPGEYIRATRTSASWRAAEQAPLYNDRALVQSRHSISAFVEPSLLGCRRRYGNGPGAAEQAPLYNGWPLVRARHGTPAFVEPSLLGCRRRYGNGPGAAEQAPLYNGWPLVRARHGTPAFVEPSLLGCRRRYGNGPGAAEQARLYNSRAGHAPASWRRGPAA